MGSAGLLGGRRLRKRGGREYERAHGVRDACPPGPSPSQAPDWASRGSLSQILLHGLDADFEAFYGGHFDMGAGGDVA